VNRATGAGEVGLLARRARVLLAIPALAVAVACVYLGITLCRQDLAFNRALVEVGFWGRGTYQPAQATIEETGRTLDELLRAAPAHPDYLELEARFLAWRAYWSEAPERSDGLAEAAAGSQYLAMLARPANRQGWAKMVEYASRTRSGESMVEFAGRRLAALQPPGQ